MRMTCTFSVKKIPLAYRMAVVSIMKEALKQSNEDYFKKIYQRNKQSIKPFVFSIYLKNYQMKQDEIHLDQLNMTWSSPDTEWMLYLYNGLQQMKSFQYKEYTFERESIRLLPEKSITSGDVVFKTLSPILIEDEHGKPVAPEDDSYAEHMNYTANLIIQAYRGQGLKQPLTIQPIQMKKVVVKESNQAFVKTHGNHKYLYFTSYKGFLRVQGDPEDLQLLYQLGLSKRVNQSFGLLEVETEGGIR